MLRRLVPITLTVLALAGVVTGCAGDDGAGVRQVAATGSASDPGSASSSGSHGGSVAAAAQDVPAGVAREYATAEAEIAAEGGQIRSGNWRVGYIVEPAEPWFEPRGGDLVFRAAAAAETHHIEIVPFEAATGRIVPDVPIRLEVLDAGGSVVDAGPLELFYAEFFHYAGNFTVPKAGSYDLRATLGAPTFRRHGEQGDPPPLSAGVTVTFEDVRLDR